MYMVFFFFIYLFIFFVYETKAGEPVFIGATYKGATKQLIILIIAIDRFVRPIKPWFLQKKKKKKKKKNHFTLFMDLNTPQSLYYLFLNTFFEDEKIFIVKQF